MKGLRLLFALVATLSVALMGTGTVSAAASSGPTCSGTLAVPGSIAPGTYSSLRVVGFCLGPPTGNVIVKGDVTVAKGAALAANYTSFDTVTGNVDANGALGVILHSSIIGGNVSYEGGGGGVNCNPGFGPFSFGVYSDAEDDVINGNLTVSGLRSCWFGEFRNIIRGSDTVTQNRFADPDATEIANNEVFRNLTCFNNTPDAQFGDAAQPPNVVLGAIQGECKPLSIH